MSDDAFGTFLASVYNLQARNGGLGFFLLGGPTKEHPHASYTAMPGTILDSEVWERIHSTGDRSDYPGGLHVTVSPVLVELIERVKRLHDERTTPPERPTFDIDYADDDVPVEVPSVDAPNSPAPQRRDIRGIRVEPVPRNFTFERELG